MRLIKIFLSLCILLIASCKTDKSNKKGENVTSLQIIKDNDRSKGVKVCSDFDIVFSNFELNLKRDNQIKKDYTSRVVALPNLVSNSVKWDSLLHKTTAWRYNNVVFYVHTYEDLRNRSIIIEQLLKSEGKELTMYPTSKLAERTLLYYNTSIERSNKISVIDIPPNWDYLNEVEDLLALIRKNLDCEFMFCRRAKACRLIK